MKSEIDGYSSPLYFLRRQVAYLLVACMNLQHRSFCKTIYSATDEIIKNMRISFEGTLFPKGILNGVDVDKYPKKSEKVFSKTNKIYR